VFESLLSDVRFAFRWLRKSPGFTAVAVVSLAIGIGFNTALFAVVDALLFRPLPVVHPEQLVDVYTTAPSSTVAERLNTSSYPDYLDLRAHNEVFDDLIGYSPMFAALSLGDRSRPGRHTRLTEAERSTIIAFAGKPAPGFLQRQKDGTVKARDEQALAQWSLDAWARAAHEAGIQVERSQIRRIFLR